MHCDRLAMPGGGVAIVCSSHRRQRNRCSACGARVANTRLCDWKIAPGKTCDAVICAACTASPAPDKDLCPKHAATWAGHPANEEH